MTSRRRRVAIVTQGVFAAGGVASVVRWLADSLETVGGYKVDIHNLANSVRDPASQRLLAPRSWRRQILATRPEGDGAASHWGAHAVEIEAMRYLPRRELTQALRGYDIIQVVPGGPALAYAALDSGAPVMLQVATTVADERQAQLRGHFDPASLWRKTMTGITSKIELTALRRVDAVFVENDVMLAFCHSIGQRNAVKAPPGVDTDYMTPAPDGRRTRGHLLTVSRMGDARKGLDRLVAAYHVLVRTTPHSPDLVIAGRGPVPATLRSQIAALGLDDRVLMRPDVDPATLLSLYQGASLFVQTSHEEGLGIAVLEAMACGLPVVATDTAGTRESVVDGKTGWLVPQSSTSRSIADQVRIGLGQAGTAAGRAGRDRCVQEFSRAVTLNRFLCGYDKVLDRSSSDG